MSKIKDLIIEETNKILEATELLSGMGDKAGEFVWEKYGEVIETYTNPTFSFVTPRTDAVWGITSTSFDPYKVDESFFDGFTFDQTYNSQTTTQQLIYMDGELHGTGGIFGSNYPRISYDPETASFTSEHTLSASVRTLSNGKFVGQKDYVKANEFLDYVVADDENSYPDGGELDGYWYQIYEAPEVLTQTKTVTAGTSAKTVTPDEGYLLESVTVNSTPSETKTVTPKASSQTVKPSSGKLLSQVTVNGDADLIAANILEGKNIFGVAGSLVQGATPQTFGLSKMAIDTFTFTTRKTLGEIINHSLGEIPSVVIIASNESVTSGSTQDGNVGYVFCCKEKSCTDTYLAGAAYKYASAYEAKFFPEGSPRMCVVGDVTDTTFKCNAAISSYYKQGLEYTIVTMA